MPKEYYLYVNGQRVKVSEQIYKVYWREKEHEKYLEQVGKKNACSFFHQWWQKTMVTTVVFFFANLMEKGGRRNGL